MGGGQVAVMSRRIATWSVPPVPFAKGQEVVCVEVDARLFAEESVIATCHEFASQAHGRVSQSGRRNYRVVFEPRDDIRLPPDLATRFYDALVDNEMRQRIARRTAAVRDVLMDVAFHRKVSAGNERGSH